MNNTQLKRIADTLEAQSGTSLDVNSTSAGYWKRIAWAVENLAVDFNTANDNESGYMLRAALALETLSGTSGAEENRTYHGVLKRIVDAMEFLSGATYEGSLPWRAVQAGEAGITPTRLFENGEAGALYLISPSTTFTDTARTTPAQVGQAVAAVTDQSGRGNHLTQTTAASRPVLRQDSGRYYYLEFDGVDDFMSAANVGTAVAWTVLASVRQTVADGYADLWNNKSSNSGHRFAVNDSAGVSMLTGNGAAFTTSTAAGATTATFVGGGKYSSGSVTAYRNGVAGAPASVTLSAGSSGWTVGRSADFAGNYFTGRIYGLLSIHRALTAQEQLTAGRFVGARAGVAP